MHPVIKFLMIVLAASLLAGCSPEAYRRSADLQVNDLLRDRKEQTLGYKPQAEAMTDVPTRPAKQAYEKVPASPIAPPTTAPIDLLVHTDLPYVPLGPELMWKDAPPVQAESTGMELLNRAPDRSLVAGPPSPADMPRQFGPFECLEYAVQHSRPYSDQMEQLFLSALDVTLQRHLFEPRAFAQTGARYTGGQKDVAYESALTVTNSVGVKQKLPYGGEVVAQGLVDFVDAINGNVNDGETAAVVLSGSVPLLRGAGMINLEGLIGSERELVYQVRAFETFRRSFVVSITSQYYQLLVQQKSVTNRRFNLRSLAGLTERAQALYDAGRIPFLDVQRALQSRLQAESDLINAEESYRSAVDNFKVTLGMPVQEQLDIVPAALEINIPTASADDAVTLAQRYRLDLRTATDRVEDAQRGVKNSENGLLPDLNLTAEARAGNETDTPAVDLNGRTATYSAGVTLDLPVDRVAERNTYRRSLISLERAQRSYVSLRDTITANVRASLRGIRAANVNVEIQRRGIDLGARRLELANERLRQGKADTREVVDAQSSLLDAQDRYEQARSTLQIRILEYMRDTGTLRVDPRAGAIGKAMDRQALERGGDETR